MPKQDLLVKKLYQITYPRSKVSRIYRMDRNKPIQNIENVPDNSSKKDIGEDDTQSGEDNNPKFEQDVDETFVDPIDEEEKQTKQKEDSSPEEETPTLKEVPDKDVQENKSKSNFLKRLGKAIKLMSKNPNDLGQNYNTRTDQYNSSFNDYKEQKNKMIQDDDNSLFPEEYDLNEDKKEGENNV